ncbi:MAG: DNA double-strand break repair nuclease NurA [Chloroflexi bacterium]|nr:DNA double-strand break repair nuclease NurA [Chloroflexota bacterium]
MANFIDQLSAKIAQNRGDLVERYHHGEIKLNDRLRAVVKKHWHRLPALRPSRERRPGYAIDGSNRRANLSNGATLFVAQGLLIGEDLNETIADVEILPGTVEAAKLERFADLMRQNLEIGLARDFARQIPSGSVLYLDGALYGTLSQTFPLEGVPRDFASDILASYRELFDQCEARNISLISIAKTNRQPLFSDILQTYERIEPIQEISDSALFDEWTERKAGFVTPVLLGQRSFSPGAKALLLEGANLKTAPAIISFFIRFADFEEPLRIDVPAFCVGRRERLGELDEMLMDQSAIEPIVNLLMDDYGGIEVYNALAYVVDREVRLSKQKMYDIYLPMVADILGEEIRLDRSERRFVD